jgi:phosphatidate phosphatase APP1
MADKGSFLKILNSLENRFDLLKFSIKKKRGSFAPIQVVPYLGYGSEKVSYIRGRVLENKGITGASPTDSLWKNLGNMFKRFESDEVADTELRFTYNQKEYSLLTDEEGYFELNFEAGKPTSTAVWQEGELEIIKAPIPFTPGIKSICRILFPHPSASFGIISDIDDTIVETNATSLLKMASSTFLNNAKTRSPFQGISAFYKALEKGNTNAINPIFYVSSSPWNLYDLLLEFLQTHDIPLGPLLLKDYGIDNKSLLSQGHQTHKYFQISRILQTYPSLSFILIGDSGQEDPSIYRQVIQDFPNRILSVYIRDVNIPKHAQKTLLIIEQATHTKVPMLLVKDSMAAAAHAVQMGYISKDSLPSISQETKKDEAKQS